MGSVTAATLTYDEYTFVPPAGSYSATPAFRHTGSPANSLLIDDVKWEALPTCMPPTTVALSNVTATSADLGWTDSGAESYNYEVRTSGAAGSGAAGLALSGNVASGSPAFTLSPLNYGTDYTVYVQGSCSGGSDLSAWSDGTDFTPGVVQIGGGTTTSSNFPIYTCYGYNYSQQIYLASEYTGQPYITTIRFKYISSGTTIANWNNWTV